MLLRWRLHRPVNPRAGATSFSSSPRRCSLSVGRRQTTVRDIADSAGILPGSRYQHFKSKEQMVEEVTRDFLDWLFSRYEEIIRCQGQKFTPSVDDETVPEQ